jgi:hypothetical protein
LSEKKIVVPDGMIKAVMHEFPAGLSNPWAWEETFRKLEAGLLWLSENPIVPKEGECQKIWKETGLANEISDIELRCIVVEWQRRMFRFDASSGKQA